jgi:hypothetical protein
MRQPVHHHHASRASRTEPAQNDTTLAPEQILSSQAGVFHDALAMWLVCRRWLAAVLREPDQ